MNPLQLKQYKHQAACYQIEWHDGIYIGHTQNAYKRFQDHISCANKGYKLTHGKNMGQVDLYGRDWSQAKLTIEYYNDKMQAWTREHELFQFWHPTGKLLNQELPMRGGVLAINLIDGKRHWYSSTRDAAKKLQLNSTNIRSVCAGRRLSTGNYTFEYL